MTNDPILDLPAIDSVVLHLGTLSIGRVARILAPGEHVGLNGEPVVEEVVELADGNRFLAREGAFVELSGEELGLIAQAEDEVRTLVMGAAVVMKELGVAPDRAALLVRTVLSRQLRTLSVPRPDAADVVASGA